MVFNGISSNAQVSILMGNPIMPSYALSVPDWCTSPSAWCTIFCVIKEFRNLPCYYERHIWHFYSSTHSCPNNRELIWCRDPSAFLEPKVQLKWLLPFLGYWQLRVCRSWIRLLFLLLNWWRSLLRYGYENFCWQYVRAKVHYWVAGGKKAYFFGTDTWNWWDKPVLEVHLWTKKVILPYSSACTTKLTMRAVTSFCIMSALRKQ